MSTMGSWDRRVLRQMALSAWERSERLHREAATCQLQAAQLRRHSQLRRSARQLGRALDGRVGLVASADDRCRAHLEELVGRRLPCLVGARDAPTALGLAIVRQPDLAVVDDDLEESRGDDLLRALGFYAPLTKALLLTDDDVVVTRLRLEGFEAVPHQADDRAVRAWLARAAA